MENILVFNQKILKLADFGFARHISEFTEDSAEKQREFWIRRKRLYMDYELENLADGKRQ